MPIEKSASVPLAKVLALVTQKGGTGKSTLTTSLAVAAIEAGESVLVIDLDKQATVADWAKARKSNTPAVAFLPDKQGARLAEVVNAAKGSYSVIMIDTKGEDSPFTHSAMTAADLCLVPIRPTKADGLANRTTVEALLRGKKRFAFLLNQCPTTPGSSRADEMAAGLSALGYLAQPMIGARVDYQDAYGAGQGVTEYAPQGKAADEMRKLWSWITDEMSKEKVPA
jgi:chromosome partitioning protein